MCYKPTLLDYDRLRFLITGSPDDSSVAATLRHFQAQNVGCVVRACEPAYSDDVLISAGINCHDLAFPDGACPSKDLIARWFTIVDEHAKLNVVCTSPLAGPSPPNRQLSKKSSSLTAFDEEVVTEAHRTRGESNNSADNEVRIAVHCVAGLGRAPLLVALALIRYGSSPENAIALIRSKRPGSINLKQAAFILSFDPAKLAKKKNSNASCGACSIF